MVRRHPVLVKTLSLDVVLRNGDQLARVWSWKTATNRELFGQRMVNANFDLMFVLSDPVDRLNSVVTLKTDSENIFAVKREMMSDSQPAMGRKWQVLTGTHVTPLEANLVELHDRTVIRAANRCPTDLGGSRNIPSH